MRPEMVIVEAPVLDLGSSINKCRKPVENQALVSELPVEALDETVIDRPTWPNEPQLDAALVGPLIKSIAGELRPVVDDYPIRQRTPRSARMLTVRDVWQQVENISGTPAKSLRGLIDDLVTRRNLITHRADRPDSGEPSDSRGLRPITLSWTNMRVQATRTLVSAAHDVFERVLAGLKNHDSQNQFATTN